MRKNVKWQQGSEQQKVFKELKQVFTTRLVLVVPDLDKEFWIEANALNYITRGVLSMKYSNKLWRPVAFIFKLLSNTERNYKIYDKEILVVIKCLEAQRYFLEKITTKFKIQTDHKNLEYL